MPTSSHRDLLLPRDPRPVLHVITSTQRRGAELVAWSLVDRLPGKHQVVALTQSRAHEVLPVPVLGPSALHPRALRRLRRLASRSSVVVGHGSRTLPASVLALEGLPTPFVYVNIGDPNYWANTRLRRVRMRRLYRRVDRVATLTEGAADSLRRDFGVRADRLRIVGSGRSLSEFPLADDAARDRARTELGLDRRSVIAYLGALSPEKRVDVLVDAVAELSDTVLVVAGDGPLRSALQERAACRMSGRALFLGARDDAARIMTAADVVALTSDTEGLPGVCIEAGLVGRPVVATDVGFVRDVVVDGKTGYVVPPGDRQATADALQRAIRFGPALGVAARRHCAKRYDLDHVVRRWNSLLGELAV